MGFPVCLPWWQEEQPCFLRTPTPVSSHVFSNSSRGLFFERTTEESTLVPKLGQILYPAEGWVDQSLILSSWFWNYFLTGRSSNFYRNIYKNGQYTQISCVLIGNQLQHSRPYCGFISVVSRKRGFFSFRLLQIIYSRVSLVTVRNGGALVSVWNRNGADHIHWY